MVKPDVKVNYYAALEVSSDASVDEIKKQYRKLALKYHPDRNPGKEEEFNSKFQAISAAHEILSDPTTKAKYDGDRRRATVTGGAPKPGASGRTGNPYAAASNFAPPPRRTQDPTGWTRTGADRFRDFPGPTPTSRAEPKKSAYQEAWSAMGGGARRPSQKPTPQAQQPQPSANQNNQRRPPPPNLPPRDKAPPPQRPDLPKREADIRGSFKHTQAPRDMTPEARAAWARFNASTAETNAQRPGFARTNTSSRANRPNAFDPSTPGDNERPASGGTAGYTRHFKDSEPGTTPPFPTNPPHSTQNYPSGYSSSRAPSVDGRAQYPPHRHSTYQHPGGEKTYLNSDQLRRSQSTRDATKLHEQPQSPRVFHTRHRSASPLKFDANGKPKQNGFTVGSDSDDISTSTDSPSSASDTDMKGSGPFGNRPRPKKIPTPPSTRLNGTVGGPPPPPQPGYQSRRGSQTQQPSRHNSASAQGAQGPQQNGHMYEPLSSQVNPRSISPHSPEWFLHYYMPLGRSVSEWKPWPPSWTIPSSDFVRRASAKQNVNPSTFQQDAQEYVAEPLLIDLANAPATIHKDLSGSTHEKDMRLLQSAFDPEFVPPSNNCTTHKLIVDPIGHCADQDSIYRFNMHFDFDKAEQAKSRSAEEINTTFSPTSAAPTFSGAPGAKPMSPTARRPSPPKRGRETLSARPSRTHINTRISNDQFRVPVSPTSAPNPQLFGEVPSTGTGEREKAFSPDHWQNHNFFSLQSGLSRGPSLRRTSLGSSNKGPTAPRPASATSVNDGDNERDSGSGRSAASGGDAMDIDPTPPTAQQPAQKTARGYAQPPSQWRLSQNSMPPPPSTAPPTDSAAAAARRRSSVRSTTDPNVAGQSTQGPTTTMPDLNPLSASLNPPNQGLNDLSSLSSSIPFQPKPSSQHPSKLFGETAPPPSPLPRVPIAPDAPQRLTKTSFKEYVAKMHGYLGAYHQLQRQLAEGSRTTMEMEERVLGRGPGGLEARGGEAMTDGVEALSRKVKEEERWNQLRNVAGEKYAGALAEFVRVKGRVGKLGEEGRLVD
ncbi:hypothetical protein B9Z65_3848 [Elsinoe australis]|uniref:J domain-containing protein n=1 Tax=Elsinoe australis TaxID=40998 RepID=A0A2P8A2R9_9PEZI|nr:hypothetical protein B9Z65_3848 [Elsinoe australis]